jgi:hypothetical protein
MSDNIQVGLIMDWRYRKNRINLHRCRKISENMFPDSRSVEKDDHFIIMNGTSNVRLKIENSGTFFISQMVNEEALNPRVLHGLFTDAIHVAKTLSLEFPGLLYSSDVYFYFNTRITASFYEEAKSCITLFAKSVFEVFYIEELIRYDEHLTFAIRPSALGITELPFESNFSGPQ